ncbi:P-loop containing nucleoside triphosphate hydrolase protein [Ascoidea rubescens DSM 1968]|uniref:p-loop containing nucleoside triphosphate hydrolase protein n=1 Tax=Ascoidea rubescens DSM 1968 TaxID=1344418 RepID=A0A1D2V8N7_9ASCO|nr:P-loop containing nucleoside triphosphate hydrolase protein [Ascoidea rubescens DSM 1968]ODV57978.1 P-loop containing nucleoside triphosphate hydrolase protein [Ascoidea rubescens DSM 1968]
MNSNEILFVGDSSIGKSSLIYNYLNNTENRLDKAEIPKLIENCSKNIKFTKAKKTVELDLKIFDSINDSKFDYILNLLINKCNIILLCFSIGAKKTSFDNIKSYWIQKIYQNRENNKDKKRIILVGLQKDLRYDLSIDLDNIVNKNDGMSLSKEINAIDYIECSSKTGENIDLVFESAALNLLKYNKKKGKAPKNSSLTDLANDNDCCIIC